MEYFTDKYRTSNERDFYINHRLLGATTSPQTANQIQEASSRLNAGVKHVELELISPDLFDSVPLVKFDRILLDAPCSGTGAIRKSLKTIDMWNPNAINRLSSYQKGLLINAFDNLNEDGTLVYSTCSVEPEENEGVIDFLLKKRDCRLEEIKLDIKRSTAILEFEDERYSEEIKKCLRIWPQDNDTEGFFVARIRKN